MISIADITIALRLDGMSFLLLSTLVAAITVLTLRRVWQRLHVSNRQRLTICGLNVIAATTFLLMFTQISMQLPVNNQLKLITSPSIAINEEPTDSEVLDLNKVSVADLAEALPRFDRASVYGDGLSAQQWQQLDELVGEQTMPVFTFTTSEQDKSTILVGFEEANWQREVVLGEPLIINLRLAKQEGDSSLYQVKLHDPANSLIANETVRMGDSLTFETVPKSTGRWRYQVSLQTADDKEIVSEQIYVNVKPGASPKVLIYQSAPSFETRHLQNWLSDMNAQVRIETQISKDKFKQQSINIAAARAAQWRQPLNAELLNWADLLVIDMRGVSQLSSTQMTALDQALLDGLGIVVIADNSLNDAGTLSLLNPFIDDLIVLADTDKTALPQWVGFSARQPVASLKSRFTADSDGLIISDEYQRGLVKVIDRGVGKLATSLMSSAYTWRIGGNRQLHSRYWQLILTEVGRSKPLPRWNMQHFSLLDSATSQVKLCASGLSPEASVTVQSESNDQAIALNLTQSAVLRDRYCASFWQQESGWHRLNISEGDKRYVDNIYFYPADTWQTLNQSHKRTVTAKRLAKNSKDVEKSLKMALPDWIVGLIWLLVMTALWIEQRWFFNK